MVQSVYFPDSTSTIEVLRKIADAQEKSISKIVRTAVEEHLVIEDTPQNTVTRTVTRPVKD